MDAVFGQLREVLKRFEVERIVKADAPGDYVLVAPRPDARGREVFFGTVRLGKRSVSYQLMPVSLVSLQPALLTGLRRTSRGACRAKPASPSPPPSAIQRG